MKLSNRYCFLISSRHFSIMLLTFQLCEVENAKFRFGHTLIYAALLLKKKKSALLLSGVCCRRGPAHTARTQLEGFVVEHRVLISAVLVAVHPPVFAPLPPAWAPFTSVVLKWLALMGFMTLLILFSYKKTNPMSSASDMLNMYICILQFRFSDLIPHKQEWTCFWHDIKQITLYFILAQIITDSQKLTSVKHKPKPPVVNNANSNLECQRYAGLAQATVRQHISWK